MKIYYDDRTDLLYLPAYPMELQVFQTALRELATYFERVEP